MDHNKSDTFQGVIVSHICDSHEAGITPVIELLNLDQKSTHGNIECYDLHLTNKYYRTTVHLFDYDRVIKSDHLRPETFADCYAIVAYLSFRDDLTSEVLDEKLAKFDSILSKGDEPKIFVCDGLPEESSSYSSLRGWCIKSGYDLLLTNKADTREELVFSLSAYKWPHRINNNLRSMHENTTKDSKHDTTPNNINANSNSNSRVEQPQLSEDLMKKLTDFDSLLGKLGAYRDQPELRGNPDDKNIGEIAEILSGLLGDDVDSFLDGEDPPSNGKDS